MIAQYRAHRENTGALQQLERARTAAQRVRTGQWQITKIPRLPHAKPADKIRENRGARGLKVVLFHKLNLRGCRQGARGFAALLLGAALALPLVPFTQGARAAPDIWLSVDTQRLHLAVMQGDTELKLFENIAIGSNGPSLAKHRGDETTPLGEFTITEIRPSERFELFMAIDYPNRDHIERAYLEQRIGAEEYRILRYDLDKGRPPHQNTSLGGQLGIHGLGRGSPEIHKAVNWTDGCIALTNEQLFELAGLVTVGTRVVVR